MEYGIEKKGICPYCSSANIEFDDAEIDGGYVYYYFCCPDCGACGSEEYRMEFSKIICDTY